MGSGSVLTFTCRIAPLFSLVRPVALAFTFFITFYNFNLENTVFVSISSVALNCLRCISAVTTVFDLLQVAFTFYYNFAYRKTTFSCSYEYRPCLNNRIGNLTVCHTRLRFFCQKRDYYFDIKHAFQACLKRLKTDRKMMTSSRRTHFFLNFTRSFSLREQIRKSHRKMINSRFSPIKK